MYPAKEWLSGYVTAWKQANSSTGAVAGMVSVCEPRQRLRYMVRRQDTVRPHLEQISHAMKPGSK